MAKHDDDNRSDQMNPNNEAYSSSRNCMSDDDDDNYSGEATSSHSCLKSTPHEDAGIEAADLFIDLTGQTMPWQYDLVFIDEYGELLAFNMPHYSDEILVDIKKFIRLNSIPYLFLLKARKSYDMPCDGSRVDDLVFEYKSEKLCIEAGYKKFKELKTKGECLSYIDEAKLDDFRKNLCKINEFVYGGGPNPNGDLNLMPFWGDIPKNIESIHNSMSPIRFKL